jgi:hypothetical protein
VSAHDREEARLPPDREREPERPRDERLPLDPCRLPEERRPFEDERPRPLVDERLRLDDWPERLREPDDERLRLDWPEREPDDERPRLDWPERLREPDDERLEPPEPPPFELCGVCELSVSWMSSNSA